MTTLLRNESRFTDYGTALDAFISKNTNGGALSSSDSLSNAIYDAFQVYYNENIERLEFNHYAILQSFCESVCKIRLAYNVDGIQGGYIVLNGELIGLFAEKGKGNWLLNHAVSDGAVKLDCFDGFLPEFYAKRGWSEYNREANWTQGEPDVVFMELKAL